MYFKYLETSARAKREHNSNQMKASAERLKLVAKKRKLKKGKA